MMEFERDENKIRKLAEGFRKTHEERLAMQEKFGHKVIPQFWKNKVTDEIVEVLQYNCVDGVKFMVVFFSMLTWWHPVSEDEKTFREEFVPLENQETTKI